MAYVCKDYCVDIRDNKIKGGLGKKKQEASEETLTIILMTGIQRGSKKYYEE